MKQFLLTATLLSLSAIAVSQANTKLSNLVAPTTVNASLTPSTANTIDLGTVTIGWRDAFLRGYVYLDGERFVSNYPGGGAYNTFIGAKSAYSLTTGKYNSTLGYQALYKNNIGSSNSALGAYSLYNNTYGNANTAIGAYSLYSNSGGYSNTAVGVRSLASNSTGYQNTAVGDSAMYAASSYNNTAVGFMTLSKVMMTGGANTAVGHEALANNTSGDNNVALGRGALRGNNTGYLNTALGSFAMSQSVSGTQNVAVGRLTLDKNNGQSNTALGNESMAGNANGSFNVAVGYRTLQNTPGSQYNTVIGFQAGAKYDNGYNNIFLGANSDVNGPGYYNVIAIGQATICTAPSQVTIGNPATNSYRAYSYWSNISDGRYKKNLRDDVPGLAFINKLKPVTYTVDASGLAAFLNKGRVNAEQVSPEEQAVMEKTLKDKEAIVETGFIAQEVEQAAKELKYNFSGVESPKNDRDVYALRYAEFVVPLVKAVQELSKENEELKKKTLRLDMLEKEVAELKALVKGSNNVTSVSALLEQNMPNPVTGTTTIRYYIPETSTSARLDITNAKGQLIKTVSINSRGSGQFNLNTINLASGTYNYTLYIEGKQVDTKRLVLAR